MAPTLLASSLAVLITLAWVSDLTGRDWILVGGAVVFAAALYIVLEYMDGL